MIEKEAGSSVGKSSPPAFSSSGPPTLPADGLLQLKRARKRAGASSLVRAFLRNTYLGTAKFAYRSALAAHRFVAHTFRERQSHNVFDPCYLEPNTAVTETLTSGFDMERWRDESLKNAMGYSFVPSDSIDYHSNEASNQYAVHEVSASIVLFAGSHPLLFFPPQRQFLFEKMHEIPAHGTGSTLTLTEFQWTSLFRPSFGVKCDLAVACTTLQLTQPAIYVGGSLNYGHFLTDYYPKFLAILAAAERDPELRARLPRLVLVYCKEIEFEMLQGLHPDFEFFNLQGYEECAIEAAALYTTNYIGFPLACELLRRQFLGDRSTKSADAGALTNGRSQRKTAYLTRRGFARRRLDNEDELIAALEAQGVAIIDVMGHSTQELAEKLYAYDIVISAFGAHTVNTIFMKPGSTLLEIVPRSFHIAHGWQYNHALFFAAGLRYIRLVSQEAGSSKRGESDATGNHDWSSRVSISKLKTLLADI